MRNIGFVVAALGLILSGCGGGGGYGSSPPPPGGKIAFFSTRDGGGEIYLMDDTGVNVRQVTSTSGTAITPSLSRDRTKIVYSARKFGQNFDIFLINSDGTGEKRLTVNPEVDVEPDISPDGRTIIFARNGGIFAINSDGSGERRLTETALFSQSPSFNAAGDKITFIAIPDGRLSQVLVMNSQVFVMNADGSGQRALTDDANDNTGPHFSPDGTQIVFVSTRQADNTGIYVMNADGSKAHRILTSVSAQDLHPAFSPDGKRIVFTSNREASGGNFHLFTLNADGTNPSRLTNVPARDAYPTWR